jgi:hypothetical protein
VGLTRVIGFDGIWWPCFVRKSGARATALQKYGDVGWVVTSPPPVFLKVSDFHGDEVGCFDRDLEVLIVERLLLCDERYWALARKNG